eukprot:12872927-Alexandrium_andersonii.AAC.1
MPQRMCPAKITAVAILRMNTWKTKGCVVDTGTLWTPIAAFPLPCESRSSGRLCVWAAYRPWACMLLPAPVDAPAQFRRV